MIRRNSYIRSTKEPNIFKISFYLAGQRVVLKKRFNDFFEASDWLQDKLTEAEQRKWKNGN